MVYWTASNNSSFLNGFRVAKSLRAAIIAARRYVDNELYGEGKISFLDGPDSCACLLRQDEKSIFTGYKWRVYDWQ